MEAIKTQQQGNLRLIGQSKKIHFEVTVEEMYLLKCWLIFHC